MADETIKKLLIKLGISTDEWKVAVKEIKKQLDTVNAQAKADAASMKATQKEQLDLTKQQIADQKRLQSEAKTLLSVDQAKAQWEKKNQEALQTKIKQRILETIELKKQAEIAAQATRAQEAQLRLQQQQIKLTQQKEALDVKIQANQEKTAAKLKAEQEAISERIRREEVSKTVVTNVTAAGKTTPVAYTATEIAQRRELLTQEKQRLAVQEQQLRILATQEGVKKEDLVVAQKQLAEDRAKLGLQEAQLRQSEQLLKVQLQLERLKAQTVEKSAVAKIQQKVGFSPFTQPNIGGIFGVGGMLGQSNTAFLAQVEQERKRLTVMDAELKVMTQQNEFRKVDIVEVQKAVAQERQRLSLMTMQVKEQKEQSLLGKITGKIGESTGAVGQVLQRTLGGGLFGGVAGGVLTGFVGAELFSGLIENVHKLGEALIEETGISRQMRQEFERLATMQGVAPTKMLDDLRVATRGLVADTDLFKMANNLLRSGMKLSNEQMVGLIANTLNLGRSMGKSSEQISRSLEMAFLNPQRGMMTLARATGIQTDKLRLAVAGIPATLGPTTKATIMFNHILEEEEKMLKRVGVPATTLPELLKQIRVAQRNFIDDMAEGMLHTNNLSEAISRLSQLLLVHHGDLERWARTLGENLSNAIHWVIENFNTLKTAIEVFIGLKLVKFIVPLTGGYTAWGNAIGFVTRQLKALYATEAVGKLVGRTPTLPVSVIGKGAVAEGGGVGWQAARAGAGLEAGAGEAALSGEAVEATAVGGGLVASFTAALPIIAAIAGAVGLLLATMKSVNLTFIDMGSAAREIAREISTRLPEAWRSIDRSIKETARYLKEEFGVNVPGYWDKIKEKGVAAWEAIKEQALDYLRLTPEGVILGIVKHFADKGEKVEEAQREKTELAKVTEERIDIHKPIEMEGVSDKSLEKLGMDRKAIAEFQKEYKKLHDYLGKTPLEIIHSDKKSAQDVINTVETVERLTARTHPEKFGDEDENQANLQLQKKLAQQRAQIAQTLNQALLDQTKQRVAAEEDAIKNEYEEGIISLEKYVNEQKALHTQEYNSELARIEKDKSAQLGAIKARTKATIDGVEYDIENEAIAANLRTMVIEKSKVKETEITTKYNQQIYSVDRQLIEDRLSAYRTFTDAINKTNLEGVKKRTSVLEKEFAQGNVGADDYIQTRKNLIEEEYQLTIQGLEAKKEAAKNNQRELVDINAAEIKAEVDKEDQITNIDISQNEIRLKLYETNYNKAKKYLDLQSQIAKATPTGDQPQKELAIARQMYSITDQYLAQQKEMLNNQNLSTEDWMNIQEHIATATEEEAKLNIQMAQLKDIAGPLGGFFGSLAGLLGEFRNTQGIVAVLQKMEGSMEKLSKFSIDIKTAGGPGAYFKDIGASIAGIFGRHGVATEAPKTAQQLFDESLGKSASGLTTLHSEAAGTAKALAELTTSASELYNALHPTKTPLQEAENKPPNVTGEEYTTFPQYQFGGYVPETGPAYLHQGEHVLTAQEVKEGKADPEKLVQQVIQRIYQKQKLEKSKRKTDERGYSGLDQGLDKVLTYKSLTDRKPAEKQLASAPKQKVPVDETAAQTPESVLASAIQKVNTLIPGGPRETLTQIINNIHNAITGQPISKQKLTDIRKSPRPEHGFSSAEIPLLFAKPSTSYQFGGDVYKTGPAYLHEGEQVVSSEAATSQLPFFGPGNTPLTQSGTLVAIAQMLGLGGNIPKGLLNSPYVTNALALIPQPLQSTVSFLNSLMPNFLSQLLTGINTPAGSKQRQQLTSEVDQYISDLKTSGYDYSGLLAWLSGQPTKSYQFGGTVTDTGLVHAHQGEEIIAAGQVSLLDRFIGSVEKFGEALESVTMKMVSLPLHAIGMEPKAPGLALPGLPLPGLQPSGISTLPSSIGGFASTMQAPTIFSGLANSITQSMSPLAQEKQASNVPGMGGSDAMSGFTLAIKSAVDGIQALGSSASSTASKLGGIKSGDETPGGGQASGPDDDEDDDSGGGDSDGISAVLSKIESLIGGIQGLVQGLTAGKNASSGALSGGMTGMQFGAAFGPYGAAAGLVAGAGLGAMFGNKEARLTADLKKVQDQMQSIIDSMNAGTISLSQTIDDLRKERTSAIQLLSGDKKGGKNKKGQPSQIQQAIAAIDQEIAQLVNEQQQILQQLTSSLITLSQPLQFQQYMQSLDQIIQQYQQFASAAVGNTQEVANANQFLNLSLQNYVTTLSQNLNQAQQQAIQDALTLINLEYERQQLMNQTAQQEYDILTQGVLTRQRTTAMTKGQQIGVIEYQRDMQLEQMNEEIALNQAKVDAETKIFGLATTRIGLENQLLAAQEEQANYQIAQVLALSQVVQDLTSGLSSGQIMTQLQGMIQGGAMPTGSGLLMLLAQILGLGGNVPGSVITGQYGAQNWLEQIPQQWQAAANYVAQQNPNFYTDFEAAAGTPPGSPQRSQAEADVQPLVAQGKVEGFDMQGFYDWLESGSIPTLQSLQSGGTVTDTGPILAHEGEYVLNASDVATLKTLLTGISSTSASANNLGPVITNLTDAVTILANGLTNNMATGSLGTSNRPGGGGIISSGLSALNELGNVMTNAMINAFKTIPSFQAGGIVPGTGPVPIVAHGGETITPPQGSANSAIANVSSLGVTSQTTMLSLTKQRTNLEMTVISTRQLQIQQEMQLLNQWSSILTQIQNGSTGAGYNSGQSNLEAMFAKVYENRGRYGSGNFRRVTP